MVGGDEEVDGVAVEAVEGSTTSGRGADVGGDLSVVEVGAAKEVLS